MKIKLAINHPDTHVRIRSKSKVKNKKILTEVTPFQDDCLRSSSSDRKGLNGHIVKLKISRLRSSSKVQCEHKRKKDREKQSQDEYYTTSSSHKWQQQREQLLKENQKLKRENKVLNDYFNYIQSRDGASSNAREKLFSFKELQSAGRQFLQSKTHKTSITKANSNLQHLEQYYY